MAIAYRSGSTAGNSTQSSLVVDRPSGTADNDILIAILYREAGTWTLPEGWAQLGSDEIDQNDSMLLSIAWKRASSEPATWTFSVSTANWISIAVGAFSGCVFSGSPFNASAPYHTALNAVTALSITVQQANSMRVVGMGNFGGDDVTVGSSGMSQGADLGGTEIWYLTQANTGASGNKTFSTLSSAYWATYHMALTVATTGAPQTISAAGAIASAENVPGPVLALVQMRRPDADVSAGSWTTQAGGTTNLYSVLDEVAASDADYIQSVLSPSSSLCTIALADANDPYAHTAHILRYRYRKDLANGNQVNLVARLLQGAAEIASWTHTNIGATWTTAEQTLTEGQAATISNYADLRIQFEATEV